MRHQNKTRRGLKCYRVTTLAISQRIAKAVKSVTESVLVVMKAGSPEDSVSINALRLFSADVLVAELGFIANFTEMKVLMEKRWLVAKAIAESH